MQQIKVNGRFYSHRPTGMQRYGIEMANRLADKIEVLRPKHSLRGGLGHLWEQLYLPLATGRGLLWSPNNTGPITVSRHVCTIHDLIPVEHPEWYTPKFGALYKWLMPRLLGSLQHMIAISEFTKQRLIEIYHVDPAKITVVPNGVDQAFRPSTPERVAEVRLNLQLGEKPYVLCVSSLEPRKNLKRLLEAWKLMPKSLLNEYNLVLAGAKGRKAVFGDVGFDDAPPNVIFTGYVAQEDLPTLYAGAAVFAYPSLYEGFGLPPLEAMACGVPVLTSSTSSIPEVIGDAGILVNPMKAEAIAEGLYRIMSDSTLQKELAGRGMERAKRLTWDSTAAQTWQVLEREAAAS